MKWIWRPWLTCCRPGIPASPATAAGFYLTATEIDNRPVGVPFYEVAPLVLQRVNGLGRVLRAGYRPVRLSGRYQEGDRRHQVAQAMPVTILIDGKPVASPPPPGPGYAATASADADIAEALTILGSPRRRTGSSCTRVYEIIEHTGLLQAAIGVADVSANRLSLFTRTACHPGAAGPAARHARSGQEPPKHPMPIAKARDLIGTLVRAWMDLLATTGIDRPGAGSRP